MGWTISVRHLDVDEQAILSLRLRLVEWLEQAGFEHPETQTEDDDHFDLLRWPPPLAPMGGQPAHATSEHQMRYRFKGDRSR